MLLRRRVVDRITSAADARITVILAPAGYGKSTALLQYLASRSDPSILFAARPDDKTLIGFARGLLESSAILSRAALSSLNEAYGSAMRSGDPGRVLAEWMALFVRELPSNSLIAVDDVQFAYDDPHTTRFLAALVDGTKDAVSWLIAIRSAHDLPVGEWLAHGEMELPVDHVDLAFSADEIRDLVAATGLANVADTVFEQWLAALEGWPIAIILALRSEVPQRGVPRQLTADEIFALLADRFFESLSDRERAFLNVASKLRSIDPALFVAAGITDVNELSARLAGAGVLVPYGSDRAALRLHDLFAPRFDQTIHESHDETWLLWANRVCDLLTERGRLSEALELCLRLNDVTRVTAIVRNQGLSFWATLHADLITRTVAFINDFGSNQTETDPVILAVQATLALRQGNVTDGTRLYAEAIKRANDPLTKARIAARLTIGSIVAHRLHQIDPTVFEVDAGSDAIAVSEIAGAQTLQLAVAGYYSRVPEVILQTIRRLQHRPNSDLALTQYYLWAGSASWVIGNFNQAVDYEQSAVRGASELGQPALVTFGYSILIRIALSRGDEIKTLYEYTTERARNEWRSGFLSTMGISRLFHLAVAVAAGDDLSIAATDRDLAREATPEFTEQFYARQAKDLAIRYTWSGSFSKAAKLAAVTAPNIVVHEDLVRLGALAMFSAGAGQRDEALAAIAAAEDALQMLTFFGVGHSLWRNLCRVYEALAMTILNNEAGAQHFLALVDGYTGPLVGDIEAVARGLAERNIAKSRAGLNMIRRRGYLGYARMLEQVERCVARARAGKSPV